MIRTIHYKEGYKHELACSCPVDCIAYIYCYWKWIVVRVRSGYKVGVGAPGAGALWSPPILKHLPIPQSMVIHIRVGSQTIYQTTTLGRDNKTTGG